MSEKIIQCCYSNVRSETGMSGWQVTAASDNIPVHVKENYVRIQDANITSQEPKDNEGNPLNIYEVETMEDYVYVTRITYGLKDLGGRHNNMLSHSYLFPLSETVLEDPNEFLTVSDENFTGDIEQAKQIRTVFKRSRAYTLERALELCGLNQESYMQLIYSMFMQKENGRTLYIHTVKGESVIRPFIYCVWMGLPFSMRRSFSCASESINPNSNKTVIFSSKHSSSELYFDLDSGENNVLNQRDIRKYKKWGFVSFFAEHYSEIDGNLYFKNLEDIAIKLGDSNGKKSKILKIAFQIIMDDEKEEKNFDELRERLFEALRAPSQKSEYMDSYICSLLKKINESGETLSKDVENELMDKLNQDVTLELQLEGEQYVINKIVRLPVEEGVQVLESVSLKQFEKYCKELLLRKNGETYLDYYYAKHYPAENSWNNFNAYLTEIAEHCGDNIPLVREKLKVGFQALYETELDSDKDSVEAYNDYVKFSDSIGTDATDESMIRRYAKTLYWNHFSFEHFSYKKAKEYKFFRVSDHRQCDCAMLLIKAFAGLERHKIKETIRILNTMMNKYGYDLSIAERKNIYLDFKEYIEEEFIAKADFEARRFYLILMLGNTAFMEECKFYCEMLLQNKVENFIGTYELNLKMLPVEIEGELIRQEYNIFLIQYIERKNLLAQMPVDILLVIGKGMYENPFDILKDLDVFSQYLPDILRASRERIVKESTLLIKDEYVAFAEEFMHGSAEECRVVKEWMSEVKKRLKVLRKNEKNAEKKSAFGGLFGKR